VKIVHRRCAGLDVHKETVVASVRTIRSRRVEYETETFGTTTSALLRLEEWLRARDVRHVGLEATGVYWKPVWHVLEPSVDLVLANAHEVRNIPGRKSDVSDAQWLSDLLAHGMIRASFVPPRPIQELRDLTRTRKQLVREIGQHTLRLQKTLEAANIKITGIVSDLLGVSGRALLRGLIAGETDPERLLAATTGLLRAPHERLCEGLRGSTTEHHRFMLRLHLEQIETLEKAIGQLEQRTDELIAPFRERVELLTTMPGVSRTLARVMVAEIGLDMSRFKTVGHLVSWAGLCPRLDESAGKRRSTKVRNGAPWLKATLVQSAWAAVSKKDSFLRSRFLRIKARRGPKKAIVAVAASMLRATYYMLRDNQPYRELGSQHFDQMDRSKAVRRLTKRIESLGFVVELRPAA
jgi:transposase